MPTFGSSFGIDPTFRVLDDQETRAAFQGVLKDASIARKLAREKSVNSDAYYAPHIGFQAKERTRLLQQLQSAFDLDRLFAVYQPQIDMVTKRNPARFLGLK